MFREEYRGQKNFCKDCAFFRNAKAGIEFGSCTNGRFVTVSPATVDPITGDVTPARVNKMYATIAREFYCKQGRYFESKDGVIDVTFREVKEEPIALPSPESSKKSFWQKVFR